MDEDIAQFQSELADQRLAELNAWSQGLPKLPAAVTRVSVRFEYDDGQAADIIGDVVR